MEKTVLRSIEEVVYDDLWPTQGLAPDPMASSRHYAIATVLQRIPERAYAKLIKKSDKFSWFIPEAKCGGMVMPFPCTMPRKGTRRAMAKVLYLGPALERRSFDVAVASVAHELAHIFLNHDVFPSDPSKQEDEAWETIIAWGFKKEERAHAKYYQRSYSRQRAAIKALKLAMDSASRG